MSTPKEIDKERAETEDAVLRAKMEGMTTPPNPALEELARKFANYSESWSNHDDVYATLLRFAAAHRELMKGELKGVGEALRLAANLPTNQTCPPENHAVVVAAMDALRTLENLGEGP